MDELGDVTNYSDGRFADGAMRFHGRKKNAAGEWRERRLSFFPLAPDDVRQLGEHTEDGGRTWKVDYDLGYRRAKSRLWSGCTLAPVGAGHSPRAPRSLL